MLDVLIPVLVAYGLMFGTVLYIMWNTNREAGVRHENELARKDRQINSLLDRIQAPNLETFKAATRPDPEPEAHEWGYDETGLVQVDLLQPDPSE